MLEELLSVPPFSIRQSAKDATLPFGLSELTEFHYQHCIGYRRIIDAAWAGRISATKTEDLPFIPASLFKVQTLISTAPEQIRLTLQSSGTTGQNRSQVFVDAETSERQ